MSAIANRVTQGKAIGIYITSELEPYINIRE